MRANAVVLLAVLVVFVQAASNDTTTTLFFGNETLLSNMQQLQTRMFGNNRQAIYVRMNLTTIDMQEKDIVLDVIAVKSVSLLFVDPVNLLIAFFTNFV